MKKSGAILILLLMGLSSSILAQNTKSTFVSASFSYDIAFVEERILDYPEFDYHLDGYTSFGIEAGQLIGRKTFSGFFRYGNSIIEPEMEQYGGQHGEIEIPDYFILGANFKYQISKLKESQKLVFNSGIRSSAIYGRYWGIRAFDDNSSPNRSKFEDFHINLFGLEAGYYFEFGRKPVDKTGLFFNIEPIYVRATTDGFGIGLLKTSASVYF